MYLNIINNIDLDNKRKNKKYKLPNDASIKDNNDDMEVSLNDFSEIRTYYSLFYGDLTKNWIELKP